MVYPKRSRVGSGQRSVDHHSPGHSQGIDCRAEGNTLAFFVHQNMGKTGAKKEESKDGRGADKSEEVPVVAAADTVVEPNTVVI